jgi:hypothetical protein
MPTLPFDVTIVVLLGIAALGVAAVLSAPKPYGIILESWRQSVDLLRLRSRLALYVLGLFIVQLGAPLLIALHPPKNPWIAAGFLVCVQSLVIYALAHVGYRLHRGLIYNEWQAGVSWGARERRMALYVLVSWFVTIALARLPIPAPPFVGPVWMAIIGAAMWLLTFVVKVFLALVGPAASLDDPKPLRQSIASVFREPVAVFSLVMMIRLGVELLNQAFGLLPAGPLGLAILRAAITLIAATFAYILSEFALVILLTRVWEDRYEPETRYAAHNLNWF